MNNRVNVHSDSGGAARVPWPAKIFPARPCGLPRLTDIKARKPIPAYHDARLPPCESTIRACA
jgi:hypothetical protein